MAFWLQATWKKVYLNHLVCVVDRNTHTHIPAGQVSNSVAAAETELLLSTGGRNRTETHWNTTIPHNELRLFQLIGTKRFGAFSQACLWAEPQRRRHTNQTGQRRIRRLHAPFCRTLLPFLAFRGGFVLLSQTRTSSGQRSWGWKQEGH